MTTPQAAAGSNEPEPTTERGKHNEKFAAQPDNMPSDRALQMLDDSISSLKDVRFYLQNTKPNKARRLELYRQLQGVIGKVGMVAWAVKE